jgi:hypothetical protein
LLVIAKPLCGHQTPTSMNTIESFKIGGAYFAATHRVEEFVAGMVLPNVSRADSSLPAQATSHGAVLRVLAWLRSLLKLNHPGDFQPILTASRSLFEVAVDATLLNRAPKLRVGQLLAWEESAKLAAAERLHRYTQSRPDKRPPERATPVEPKTLGRRSGLD